jgi:dimethylamine monooxygenase subunit A
MTVLAHTPFDGTSQPFTIGLRPLDLSTWIEIDRHYGTQLKEKDRLIAERPQDVFAAEDDTVLAQEEVADLVAAHLRELIPPLPPQTRPLVEGRLASMSSKEPPLQAIARCVQEDLVLMRKGEDGWRLAAASLCFPSSWSLHEKFGRPMDRIHAPVPGFSAGTRNAVLIERIFDRLLVEQPVQRYNWSIQDDATLFKQSSHHQRGGEPGQHRVSRIETAARTFMRVERQTLRKLPRSGDILFTIRIHLDPIATLRRDPRRVELADGFAEQLAALDPDQLAYKGLTGDRDLVINALHELSRD